MNDKIWIQGDNTETGIANLLTAKGISQKEIVLAYYPQAYHELTDFAVS